MKAVPVRSINCDGCRGSQLQDSYLTSTVLQTQPSLLNKHAIHTLCTQAACDGAVGGAPAQRLDDEHSQAATHATNAAQHIHQACRDGARARRLHATARRGRVSTACTPSRTHPQCDVCATSSHTATCRRSRAEAPQGPQPRATEVASSRPYFGSNVGGEDPFRTHSSSNFSVDFILNTRFRFSILGGVCVCAAALRCQQKLQCPSPSNACTPLHLSSPCPACSCSGGAICAARIGSHLYSSAARALLFVYM
jgi:hypothetical protein